MHMCASITEGGCNGIPAVGREATFHWQPTVHLCQQSQVKMECYQPNGSYSKYPISNRSRIDYLLICLDITVLTAGHLGQFWATYVVCSLFV